MVRDVKTCTNIDEVRAEIDRLDKELISLLAERTGYVDQAVNYKSNPGEAVVEWRIQQVIDNVRSMAENEGMDPNIAEKVWRTMIDQFIEHERVILSRSKGE